MKKESMEKIEKKESFEQPIKNLLVIEDTSENLEGAQQFFKGDETKVSVDYARDYKTVEKLLKEKNYDGILTDLFFPNDIDNLEDTELAEKLVKEMKEAYYRAKGEDKRVWIRGSEKSLARILTPADLVKWGKADLKKEQPLGVLVARLAKENKIPYTIFTKAGHGLWESVSAHLVLEDLIKSVGDTGDEEKDKLNPYVATYNPTKRKEEWQYSFKRLIGIVKAEQSESKK
jgi:ASC-1-like (ASCH) protein